LAVGGDSAGLQTVIALDELRTMRERFRRAGESVAFVPTMGALHDGHLRLVLEGKRLADRVIVSIFVNPLQFGPTEDFSRYPRTMKADIEKLATVHADAVFLPNTSTMYPEGHQTVIRNKLLDGELCGAFRPGHFEGVLTVVMKLFNMVQPDIAVFGKKDYQQWRLIETMARDLNHAVRVVGVPTIREQDGLAMSSRNRYLTEEQRPVAAKIHAGLTAVQKLYVSGNRDQGDLLRAWRTVADSVAEFQGKYAEVRRQRD